MGDIYLQGAVHSGDGQPRGTLDTLRRFSVTADGSIFAASYLDALAREGRIYVASDGDENDTVTGQTSYAATSPTFLLSVPDDVVAIPLFVRLVQAGTVAGDNISVAISADNTDLFSSGGTSENIDSTRTDAPRTPSSTLRSGATASAATSNRIILDHVVLAEDVDPASADAQKFDYLWTPSVPVYVVGAGSFLVYTYAATTGPTWRWAIGWAEIPESEL